MSAAPELSIVIPVYNEGASLHAAVVDLIDRLATAAAQHPILNSYEILLSENGSSDGTVAIGESWRALYRRCGSTRLDSQTTERRSRRASCAPPAPHVPVR